MDEQNGLYGKAISPQMACTDHQHISQRDVRTTLEKQLDLSRGLRTRISKENYNHMCDFSSRVQIPCPRPLDLPMYGPYLTKGKEVISLKITYSTKMKNCQYLSFSCALCAFVCLFA